jgi:EAL domain-containing protein (putative c-di-GMP-specific phosphodiesterase class I)
LEILETPKMNIDKSMKDMFTWMKSITKQGYSIGLDDFGADDGCHTMKHVKKLPISFLKLDGAVIQTMLNDTFNRRAYSEVFTYCIENDIDIIAEHVESAEDARRLIKLYPITHIQSRNVQPEDFG